MIAAQVGLHEIVAADALYQQEAARRRARVRHVMDRGRRHRDSLSSADLVARRRITRLAAHPHCDISVAATNDPGDIERDGVDVAIWHFRPGGAPSGALRLATDEVLPVCAPALLANGSKPLKTPEDLAHHVLLRFETPVGGKRRIDWVRMS